MIRDPISGKEHLSAGHGYRITDNEPMIVITPDTPHWDQAVADTLTRGGVVVHPTDTAYGLAVDATNEGAVKKVFSIKQRSDKPLIMVVRNKDQARDYVHLNDVSEKLIEKFWPGALTLVLPKKDTVPSILTADSPSVGIRIPDSPITQKMSQAFPKPYTSTSANISGKSTPYSVETVLEQLGEDMLDLVIDAGPLKQKPTSTVIDVTTTSPEILREGPIPFEKVLKTIQ